MDLKGLSDLYDHVGPLGFVVIIMAACVTFMALISWRVLAVQNSVTRQLTETQKQVVSTQDRLVTHLTVDAERTRSALENNSTRLVENTNSNAQLTDAQRQSLDSSKDVKKAIDELCLKIGSDPGCKVTDPRIICQAEKMGITTEKLIQLFEEVRNHMAEMKVVAKETVAKVEEKAKADAAALERVAVAVEAKGT